MSDAQGLAICRLALATTRRYKGRDGEKKEETEWHNVVVFGKTAEVAQQYLVKGSEVYIEGRLHTRKYTDKQGVERYATEVVCESLQLGAKPQGKSAPTTTAAEYAAAKGRDLPQPAASVPNEDVPF
jgi:single-strand DNA-binding protein